MKMANQLFGNLFQVLVNDRQQPKSNYQYQ